jgi:hypothetical protein
MKNTKDINQEKLILKHRGDFDYFLLSRTENSEAVIASLNPDEWEQKLSKENCDKIFGVVDVEKLAKKEYREFPTNPKDKSEWKYNRDNNYRLKRKAYIKGFNKAMELNKDRIFTLEKMFNIIDNISFVKTNSEELNSKDYQPFITDEDGQPWTFNKQYLIEYIQSLQQPTEIEVDIVMECKTGCVNFIFNGENSLCCGDKVPRLDSNNCLILKPIK